MSFSSHRLQQMRERERERDGKSRGSGRKRRRRRRTAAALADGGSAFCAKRNDFAFLSPCLDRCNKRNRKSWKKCAVPRTHNRKNESRGEEEEQGSKTGQCSRRQHRKTRPFSLNLIIDLKSMTATERRFDHHAPNKRSSCFCCRRGSRRRRRTTRGRRTEKKEGGSKQATKEAKERDRFFGSLFFDSAMVLLLSPASFSRPRSRQLDHRARISSLLTVLTLRYQNWSRKQPKSLSTRRPFLSLSSTAAAAARPLPNNHALIAPPFFSSFTFISRPRGWPIPPAAPRTATLRAGVEPEAATAAEAEKPLAASLANCGRRDMVFFF